MKSYKYFLLFSFCIVVNCSKNTVDEVEDINIDVPANPIVFEFDQDRNNSVQEKYDEFIDEYNNKVPQSVSFNSASSFLQDLHFGSSCPLIFRFPFSQIDGSEISEKMMEFYVQWKDLFGCLPDDLENDLFNYNSSTEEMFVSFKQTKFGKSNLELVDSHGIEFRINKQGQLLYLMSNLIPEGNLKAPTGFDHEAALQNIYGDSVVFNSGYNQYTHVFSDTNSYNYLNNFKILVHYEDNKMYVFAAKPVNVSASEFPRMYFTIYVNPENSEIIEIRSHRTSQF